MRIHRTGGKTKQEAIFPFKRRLSRPGVPFQPSKRKGPAILFLLLDRTGALLKTPNKTNRTSKGNSSRHVLTRSSEESSFPMSLRTLHPHPEMLGSWTWKARGMLPQSRKLPHFHWSHFHQGNTMYFMKHHTAMWPPQGGSCYNKWSDPKACFSPAIGSSSQAQGAQYSPQAAPVRASEIPVAPGTPIRLK